MAAARSSAPADDATASSGATDLQFTTSDGIRLRTTLMSQGAPGPKPTVVEFTPYGYSGKSFEVGDDYHYLLVQLRGTGSSGGSFDALGPRSQKDVVEVLRWACDQPWSGGDLAVAGFSASAIMLFNSWHQKLPCVRAAVTRSGTHELYRDLLMPGGISNLLPGLGVIGLIGAPALLQGPDRLATDPFSTFGVVGGLLNAGLNAGFAHPTLDKFWRERGWRGDANDIPLLAINGFFDVESRGAFEAFRALREDGSHLLMAGGHDGFPQGTDGGSEELVRWLDHFVRGVDNGVEKEPTVQLLLSRGDRQDYLQGDYETYSGSDWPLPATSWTSLALDAERSGTSLSPNDGTLSLTRPKKQVSQRYLNVPSNPFMTDVPNAAIVGNTTDPLLKYLPFLTDGNLSEPLGLAYTSAPLARGVTAVGPASLELRAAVTTPGTQLWAVLSDVAPDGSSHPITTGRLSTDFPYTDRSKSIVRDGEIVQPYANFGAAHPARPGEARTYRIEMWPIGNRFEAGHRIRLQVIGASLASRPALLPGVTTVGVGGPSGSRLLFPTVPDQA